MMCAPARDLRAQRNVQTCFGSVGPAIQGLPESSDSISLKAGNISWGKTPGGMTRVALTVPRGTCFLSARGKQR